MKFNYDKAFGRYLSEDWQRISTVRHLTGTVLVTWRHVTGAVIVVHAGPKTHSTGHPWTLTAGGLKGTGHKQLLRHLSSYGID